MRYALGMVAVVIGFVLMFVACMVAFLRVVQMVIRHDEEKDAGLLLVLQQVSESQQELVSPKREESLIERVESAIEEYETGQAEEPAWDWTELNEPVEHQGAVGIRPGEPIIPGAAEMLGVPGPPPEEEASWQS